MLDFTYICDYFLLRLVSKLNPFPGMKHLDVAGGTGMWRYLNERNE